MELSITDTLDPIASGQAKGATCPDGRGQTDETIWLRASPSVRTAVEPETIQTLEPPGARYAPGGFNYRAFAVVAAIHVLAIAALLGLGVVKVPQVRQKHLTVFTVSPPAPPPEPAPQPEAEPQPLVQDPQPTAVKPMIELPSRSTLVIDAAPVQSAVAVKVDAPPAPKAAPAPPAPVTPPDFSAAQLNNPGPSYPYAARRAREQGTVMLKVLVTPEGRAGDIEINESSGFDRLDQAAIQTVRKWRFVPAKQAGKPVAAWVLVPVGFQLN